MKKFLIFDTETNGLPQFSKPSDDKIQPHIVTVAALLVDEESFEIKEKLDLLVRPDGWSWDQDCKAYQTHGIEYDFAVENGMPEKKVLELFMEFYDQAEYRVAHNTTFDNRIIRIAQKRYGWPEDEMKAWKEDKKAYKCTGNLSKPILELPPKGRFGWKMPRLEEAYEYFTGKEMENAHNAMADCLACLEVYKGILNHKPDPQKIIKKDTMGLEDAFTFGKHKGEQLEDVIEDHPSYIEWLIDNEVCEFDDKATALINKKKIA